MFKKFIRVFKTDFQIGDVMQRKLRKKISKTGIMKGVAVLFFGGFAVAIAFQNCSQVSVSDMTVAAKEEMARIARIGASEETVTVGINPVPNLKLFFSVDNSGTMERNQLNLAESFSSMFDQNSSDSLSKFDTTILLTNTAQRSPLLTEAYNGQNILEQILFQQTNGANSIAGTLNETDYLRNIRTVSKNVGRLAGDNLGFRLSASSNPLKYEFQPAFVSGVTFDNDVASFQESIRKPAGVSGAAIEEDFKKRVELLNNKRIPLGPLVNNTYRIEHADIVDNESGLCSVARILRNPDQYLSSGDLAAFTIVSDEDDIGADGSRCIQSITKYTGQDALVDGKCMKATSTLKGSYTTSTSNADTCAIAAKKSLTFQFSFPQVVSNISYRVRTVDEAWSLPKVNVTYGIKDPAKAPSCTQIKNTRVKYPVLVSPAKFQSTYTKLTYTQTVPTYATKKTLVKYYYERCYDFTSDGGVSSQICNLENVQQSATVLGNQSAATACLTSAQSLLAARNISGARVVNTTANPVNCTYAPESTNIACNPATNANCVIGESYVSTTVTPNIAGDHTSATACLAKAQTQPGFKVGTTPNCVIEMKRDLAACGSEPVAANCSPQSAPVYGYIDSIPLAAAVVSQTSCASYAASTYATAAKPYASAGEAAYPSICTNEFSQTTAVCTTAEASRGGVTSVQGYKVSNPVPVDGKDFTTSQCLNSAQTLSGYVAAATSGITPSCSNGTAATVGSCTTAQQALGCIKTVSAQYAMTGVATANDVDLSVPSACLAYVQSGSVNNSKKSATLVEHVACTVSRNSAVTRNRTVEISLKTLAEQGIDDGVTVPNVGAACGAYYSYAFSNLSNSDGFVRSIDDCKISQINSNSYPAVSIPGGSSCAAMATAKCESTKERQCVGTSMASNPTLGNVQKSYSVNERLTCASLCSNSKTNFCNGLQNTQPTATVASFIKADMANPNATCELVSTESITASAINKTHVLDATKEMACPAEAITGIPYYFTEKTPRRVYYDESVVTDYVSGVKEDGTPVHLVDYIKARSQELAGGQMIFSALVRLPGDSLGDGGSVGTQYLRLVDETGGQSGSALSNDYSVALRDLGRIIKENLVRSMALRTMKADQIIKKVYKIGANGEKAEVAPTLWSQNGVTLLFSKQLEISEGDQFLVKFQNNVDEEL